MKRASSTPTDAWSIARDRLHERGLRWTPQRRLLVGILANTEGHITAAELLDRCRAADPHTTPSTVYRTLDVLEDLEMVRHAHGMDGREEFHVLPRTEHGHLRCADCGRSWEIDRREGGRLVGTLARARGFQVDLSHLTVVGRCAECSSA